jgi:hypothetical protein
MASIAAQIGASRLTVMRADSAFDSRAFADRLAPYTSAALEQKLRGQFAAGGSGEPPDEDATAEIAHIHTQHRGDGARTLVVIVDQQVTVDGHHRQPVYTFRLARQPDGSWLVEEIIS